MSKESQDILTIEEVAAKLQVSERYVRDNVNNKELKAYKRGKRVYVLFTDLVDWIKQGKPLFK